MLAWAKRFGPARCKITRVPDDWRPTGATEDAAAEDLLAWLSNAGFVVASEKYSERNFGNRSVELVKGKVQARVVRERGQWWLEVGRADGEDDLFDPALWLSFQRRGPDVMEPNTIAADTEALKTLLPEIEEAVANNAVDWQRLRRLRAERSARRLGFQG